MSNANKKKVYGYTSKMLPWNTKLDEFTMIYVNFHGFLNLDVCFSGMCPPFEFKLFWFLFAEAKLRWKPGLRPPRRSVATGRADHCSPTLGGRHPREKQRKALQNKFSKPNLGFLAIFSIPKSCVILRLNNGSSKRLGFLYGWRSMYGNWYSVWMMLSFMWEPRSQASQEPNIFSLTVATEQPVLLT